MQPKLRSLHKLPKTPPVAIATAPRASFRMADDLGVIGFSLLHPHPAIASIECAVVAVQGYLQA